MPIRPLTDGDDLSLGEVFSDASTPAGHMARSLFRPASDSPLLRSVIAEVVPGVPVGAAAIAESPLHPFRAWVHVEVAAEEQGHGLGRELFEAVSAETAGTALEGLDLRARVSAGSHGAAFAEALGFAPLTTTRVISVPAGSLPPSGGGRAEDLEIVATGSVALTKAFLAWYAAVNKDDAVADLTIGQVAQTFLSEASGAHGAALLTGSDGLSAFAVSYARADAADGSAAGAAGSVGGPSTADEPATELILGSMWESCEDSADTTSGQFAAAVSDVELLLARLSVDADVIIEVTSGMPVVSALADGLLASGAATELYRYETLTGPPADSY